MDVFVPALILKPLIFLALFLLTACSEPITQAAQQTRILAVGDSLLAWNAASDDAISDEVARQLGEPVLDRSVVGAHVIYNLPISGALGLRIASQYRPGNWDWVIMNGGGNDLWLGCGCGECDARMTKMLSADGSSGAIADLVAQARRDGAKVVYVGYLRSPGRNSPIEGCKAVGDAFDARLAKMAKRERGVFFVSNADLVPEGDLSFHAFDRIHPSIKGSRAIGARVAKVIAAAR